MLRFLTVGLAKLLHSRKSRSAAATAGGGGGTDADGTDADGGDTASGTAPAKTNSTGGDADASTGDDKEMGFFEHLEELRAMLIRCLLAFVVAMVCAFYFAKDILTFMRRPLQRALADSSEAREAARTAAEKAAEAAQAAQDAAAGASAAADPVQFVSALANLLFNGELAPAAGSAATAPAAAAPALGALEKMVESASAIAAGQTTTTLKFMDIFTVLINIGVIGGIALSSAPVLYFAGRFVAPALTPSEKRCLVPFGVAAILLFFAGCAFSFFWLTEVSIKVMFHFIHMFGMNMVWVASDYYSLVTMMTLLVGVTFQFPLVIIILQYLEIVRTRTLFSKWRHVLVGILVGSLLVTPLGDPVSLSMFTIVLFALYMGAAGIGWLLVRGKIQKREREEAEYERQYGHRPRRDDDDADADTSGTGGDDDYADDYNYNDTDDYPGNYDSNYNPETGETTGEDAYNYEEDYGNDYTDDQPPTDETNEDATESADATESTDAAGSAGNAEDAADSATADTTGATGATGGDAAAAPNRPIPRGDLELVP
ncbi:MAG: twin-arginine translocase subunit TatC [Puniceicoccales bacterium]|jgi:sec-independent protein translocase protein TatC|nr:twin-arginine translocase subunit TatC [Puniceicoccales bacterium]